MSTIAEILDRLSGVTILKERLTETNRNVDKSLAWLLDHEKRLIHLEAARRVMSPAGDTLPPSPLRLPRK